MANEFIARKGIISLDSAQVTGSLSVTGNISASIFTGSFIGDGSQLSGVSAGFPFTGSAEVTGSLTVTGSVSATTFLGDGSQLTGIGSPIPVTATVNTGSSPLTLTTQSIVVADSTDGDITINLPDLDAIVGTSDQKPIVVYKNDYSQNVIYVNPSGSQLVNGASQDIIVSIQLAVIYNPTSAGWVTEGTSAQSLAELELFFVPRTETGSLSVATASYVEYTNVANKPALVSGSSQIFAGYDYEIHVSQVDGNDTTGNGDLLTPVASITKALTLTTSSRKTIIVHPGTYSENITVGTTNTTIATSELTGANTLLSGTLTIGTSGSGTRISGLKMTNLVISGTAQAYISNCTIDDQVTKSSSGYVEIINSEMQCTSGIQISGAGTTIINGNKNVGIAVSNASAQVIIKGCNSVVTPSASAGNLAIVDCIVTALGGNGITITGASTTLTLLNSQVLVQAGNNVAPISVAGIYSIINTIYDKPGSTLTGTSTDSVDYFQYINADNITSTNGLTVTGSLTVTGQVVAQTLNVQQVTSSIVFSSGSNIFGNSLANTQQFTGSVSVTGSLTVVTAGTELQVTSTGVNLGNALTDSHIISGSLTVNPNGLFVSGSGVVGVGTTSPTQKFHVFGDSDGTKGRFELRGTGGINEVLQIVNTANYNPNRGVKMGLYVNSGSNANQLGAEIGSAVSGVTSAYLFFSTTDSGTTSEKIRITSGGNVGIGTTNPSQKLEVVGGEIKAGRVDSSSEGGQLSFGRASDNATGWYIDVYGNTSTPDLRFVDVSNSAVRMSISSEGYLKLPQSRILGDSDISYIDLYNPNLGNLRLVNTSTSSEFGNIILSTNNTERMRITSGGNVLVGTTTTTGNATGSSSCPGAVIEASGTITSQRNDSANIFLSKASGFTEGILMYFYTQGSPRGSISTNGVTTSYNVNSDYRLKEDLKTSKGLDIINQIKIYDYKWKESDLRMDGVLAHELAEVLPYAVQGEKDEIDAEGNDKMQSVDYSKLVPVLVKAIQEQQAQIESLKAEIQTLKQ
jgi:hypothetical protein